MYRSPPEEIVEAAESIYQALPDDAQPEYLADETLHRRINTARRRFNDWMDALQRSKEMPSPMEAGPANYPADKARDRSQRAREASEDLDDALDNVKSAVRGARQRALEAIGSSVAEQNAKENRSLAERRKNRTRKGYIVLHFNGTRRGVWLPWGVKRVNQKSLRLRRPHARAGEEKDSPLSNDGETYPEYREVTVDLDSDFLIVPPAGDVSTDVLLEAVEDKPEGNTGDWEHYDTWAGYQEDLLGEDFVEGLESYNPGEEIDQAGGEIDRAGGDGDQEAATDGGVYDPTDEVEDNWTTDEERRAENQEHTDHTAADDRANWEEMIEATVGDRVRWNNRKEMAEIVDADRDVLGNHIFDVEGPRGGEYTLTANAENPSFPYVEYTAESGGYGRVTDLEVDTGADIPETEMDISEPVDGTDNRDEQGIYDPTDEWTDDRPQQDTLVETTAEGQAARDRETRVETGASDEFADDRTTDSGDPDAGEQASLTAESVEGQMDLTGETAERDPDWQDHGDSEGFEGINVDDGTEYPEYVGEWDRSTESAGKAGTEDVYRASGIEVRDRTRNYKPGVQVEHLATETWTVDDSHDDVVDWMMENDPEDAAAMLDVELGDCGCDMDDWTGAVDYLRQHYSDDYQARIELAADLREFASEQGMDAPQSLGDEGVLQPLVRYQNVDPADAKVQIEDRAPSHHHDALFDVITAFAASEAARHDESPDSRSTYDPCCEYDNPEEWGPTATRPISDVAEDLKSPAERRVEQAERERAEYEESPGGWMKDDEDRPERLDLERDAERAGVDPDEIYDPTDDMDPGETTSEVVEDLSKPPGVDAANAVVDAVSEDSDGADDTGDETEESDDTDNTEDERPERIEFGSKDAADELREQYPEHVHESDDRRKKTVAFEPDTPENVLDQAGREATISMDQHKEYGQVPLTAAERDRLEDRYSWNWSDHGFHAQAAKALLQEEGGTPWLDYYDHSIGVDEHLSVIDSGKEMSARRGLSGPGETGRRDDREQSEAEIARNLDEAHSRMCRRAEDACEEGEEEACEALLQDCGYSEDEIAALMEATRELGESPLDVYDPTTEADETTSFEDWAREQEPARPDPEEIDGPVPERPDPPTPDEPDDEELRRLAPVRLEEMSGATLGALRKAWAGYKMARAEDREAHERMDEYAEIINGIRVVNDQEPIDFDQRDGWDGGPVLSDDPNEEYPVGDGTRQKSLSKAIRDGAAGVIEGAHAMLGDTYDPTEEF
jgi:hypothetical protein